MHELISNLRHAGRLYAATPVASSIAVGALAVAMASVAAFLTLFSDLVLKSPPGFEPGPRLVSIGQSDGTRFDMLAPDLIERIGEEVSSVEAISGIGGGPGLATTPSAGPTLVEFAMRGFFENVRPRIQLGRGFAESEYAADAEPVAVISDAYWREAFDGRQEALGETVRVTGLEQRTIEFRIVGVMAPALRSTFPPPLETALWMPFEPAGALIGSPEALRRSPMMLGVARLRDDASVEAFANELNARYLDSAVEFNMTQGYRLDALHGVVRNVGAQREAERQVRLFLAGSVLLAVVAAINVSLFLLSRAPARRRELGIRMAVGARRKRLARQLVTEAGLLVVGATLLGLVLNLWLGVLMQELPFLEQAQWRDVSALDWRALGLVAAFSLTLTGLVSLAPVLGLRGVTIGESSRFLTARPSVAERIASTVQIAIMGGLGAAAIAFGGYLGTLLLGDRGYEVRDIHIVAVGNTAPMDAEAVLVERERRRNAILALPGIEAVAFGGAAPGWQGRRIFGRVPRPDAPAELVEFTGISVDSGYVDILDLEIIDGRNLEPSELGGALVNEAFARELWGRTDTAGETLPLPNAGAIEIVGVIENFSFGHPALEPAPIAFLPFTPASAADSVFIRSALSTAELRESLRQIVDDRVLEVTIRTVESLSYLAAELIAADRARTFLAAGAAVLVVVLAALGFYGTQLYLVSTGRREFAVRAALGAGPRALGLLVLTRGLTMGWPGLVLGALLAFIVVAWLRDEFVPTTVSPIVGSLAVTCCAVMVLLSASLGPARQARGMKPAVQLREE